MAGTLEELFSVVSTLNGVNRFSMLKLCHQENVLEHTGMVAIFAYVLAHKCNRAEPNSVDLGAVLTKALAHDLDETITGDVARPTKYHTKELRHELQTLETAGIKQLAVLLDVKDLEQTYLTAKVGTDGLLVAIADIAAAVHRVWEEVLVYNNYHLVAPAKYMPTILYKLHRRCDNLSPGLQWVLKSYLRDLERVLGLVAKAAKDSPFKELYNAN